jgi:hypothetical protein
MKLSNSFAISILGLISLTILAIVKGIDTSTAISGIILSYVGSRSAQKVGIVYSSSKDVDSNTDEIIKEISK